MDDHYENFSLIGYEFKENGMCENKAGYYEYADTDAFMITYPERKRPWKSRTQHPLLNNILYSYGTTTYYTMSDDTLSIYNPSLRQFEKRKVFFSSKDTMILSDASNQEEFVRKKYIMQDSLLFDKIIIFFPETRYKSPRYYSLSQNGDFVMYYYNQYSIGTMVYAKTKREDFEKMELAFRKSNFKNLTDTIEYYDNKYKRSILIDGSSGLEFASMTTVSNNKIFTIEEVFSIDFDEKEFYWAYLNSLFYPERMQFDQPPYFKELFRWEFVSPDEGTFANFAITRNDSILYLCNTEAFHLITLLDDAVETDTDFTPTYQLKGFLYDKEAVETDGRFFRYKRYGKPVTLDLGFNFIKVNDWDKYLRKKNEYSRINVD